MLAQGVLAYEKELAAARLAIKNLSADYQECQRALEEADLRIARKA